jgi:GH15 family glucan-1,4-alpha-glucosidase
VNVIYENIDAILINESDYELLKDLGYIHDTQLGKFKVEHIFTEICIISQKKYIATTIDGTKIYHCINKDLDYDDLIEDAISKISFN